MSSFAQTTIELTQSSDLTTSTSSSGGAAGIGIGMIVLYLAFLVFFWVCLAKIYMKAGRKWWEAIVPIYSTYVLLKIIGRPGWWLILYFVPFVNIVIGIINLVDLAKAFGKGLGTALGLIFLPIIMYPVMAFGSSYQYKGEGSGGSQPDGSGSSPAGNTPGATVPKEGDGNLAGGAVTGGAAAASSSLGSEQDTSTTPQAVADSSDQSTNVDIGGIDSPQDSSDTIAQADSAPSYPGEESSPDLSDDTAETTASTPDSSESSGSTEEPQLSGDNFGQPEPKPEDESSSPDSDNGNKDDQSAGGAAGPTFG